MEKIATWWNAESNTFTNLFGYGEISYSHKRATQTILGAMAALPLMYVCFFLAAAMS